MVSCGHRNREFVAGDTAAEYTLGQRLPYSLCDGNDKLIAAENPVRRSDVVHAIFENAAARGS